MCSWLTLRLYAEDGRIIWESVGDSTRGSSNLPLCFVPIMYYIISNDVMILMIAEQYIPMMSCMQVLRLLHTTIAEYNIITLA